LEVYGGELLQQATELGGKSASLGGLLRLGERLQTGFVIENLFQA
jgi:hypothetical protein